MPRLHKDAVLANRHAIHSLSEFVNEAARDAHVYLAEDVGKVVTTGTGSGRRFWLIQNVASGAGSFLELGAAGGGGEPDAHAASHEDGGDDEISVDGLAGQLAEPQVPADHASTHEPGGTDALSTAAPGTITPDAAAAEGSATSFARSDHVHAIAAAAAGSAVPGDAAAEGSSSSFARADHVHGLPPFGRASGEFAEGDDLDDVDDRLVVLESVSPIITQWTPDAPPTGSAHAKSDEFETGSAWDGKWTEFDQSAELTPSVSNGFGVLRIANQAAVNRSVGMYQAIPTADDWCFAAKMHMAQTGGNAGTMQMGIFLSESLSGAPTTADWYTIRLLQGLTNEYSYGTFTAYNSAAVSGGNVSRVDRTCYFRCRVVNAAGTYSAKWDWSDDGIGWHEIRSALVGFTPVHFGVYARNLSSGADALVYTQWFRVVETAVTFGDLIPGGRVLNVFA